MKIWTKTKDELRSISNLRNFGDGKLVIYDEELFNTVTIFSGFKVIVIIILQFLIFKTPKIGGFWAKSEFR
jgi:hypothetical protein